MAVFSQEKTVCLFNTQKDRQMAVSSNSLSVSGMFSSPQSRRMAVFPLGKQFVDSPGTSRRMAVFTLKTVRPPSNKVISPSKERGPICQSFKDVKSKGKMVKFLYSRQMASYLQAMVRSLTRKQTFKVSLLPSNGISSPSADKKFDEETNL